MTSRRWASLGERSGPALVHGVPDVVVDRATTTVASQAIRCTVSSLDQAAVLELAGQGALAPPAVLDQGGQGDVGHHDGPAAWLVVASGSAEPGPEEWTIPIKASQRRWSKGVSPSDGICSSSASTAALVSA